MSTSGTNFLYEWISTNVPKTGADVISVADLTQKLFADAKAHHEFRDRKRYRKRL